MMFRVVRANLYNQDLGLIHSTNGNHLESPNEGSSIDHQVTIHLHAQNITMFPTNGTCSEKSVACVTSGCFARADVNGVSVPIAQGGNVVILVSAKKSRRWGYATPFDLVGTQRMVPAFGLLGNPGAGLVTSCCLCKTPAFGIEDQSLQTRFLGTLVVVIVAQKYKDARASGDTALSSPCWDLLATMRRVVNYHNSWARQRQVELFDASGV
ncbi:leucine--tRNA ligase, mitochondrial [Dorcoceras hygrometricum]|uniref:Leucine--tRNA ligase, mitochondrial n=1 Tax=Dorcoceras hygrometricum TaxID=472368 RepID=A0A2Z7D5Y9_9LAMI|nr:leucine--tRNA ligase, mitochondrial [Dorcoceras hygrometricum]